MLTFMWGVYCPDSPTKHTVCAPGHTLAPIIRRQQMGRSHCFWRLAISSNSCCHFHGKEHREGKSRIQCIVFLSARLGRAFALLMAIINNGPYEDNKIITSILTSECLSGGSSRWLPVSFPIWHQILETGSHPLCLNLNFRWSAAVTGEDETWKGHFKGISVCFNMTIPRLWCQCSAKCIFYYITPCIQFMCACCMWLGCC